MKKQIRCAIYTRKSTEEGLEQDFNSLDAQREACESYIKSQTHESWVLIKKQYDDGGYSGGTMERPAFKELLEDIKNNKIDIIVVYKVDRLTRSLMDFSKIIEIGIKSKSGKPFARGHLYERLSNKIYLGKIVHKDKVYDGQHEPIVSEELFTQVQNLIKTNSVCTKHKVYAKNPTLLTGLLYDDKGNHMTTTSSSGKNKRLRKLRFLPPEIIEAIMNGTQDPELNVKKLIAIANEYVKN